MTTLATSHSAESQPAESRPCVPSCGTVPAWHAAFLLMLPTIEQHARIAFRDLKGDRRAEAVQEAVCNACCAYTRLARQGRTHAATWSSLARYAVAQVRDGRTVGTPLNTRDVCSRRCQQKKRVDVHSLHRWDEQDQEWTDLVVEDRHSTPADIAAFRIDSSPKQAASPFQRNGQRNHGCHEH